MIDWDGIEDRLARIVAESPGSFEPAAVANAHDLVALARTRCPPPEAVGKGYWSTFRFIWGNLELEVFDDRIEVYRFFDGRTDIWHEAHAPGTPFSADLVTELPTHAGDRREFADGDPK